MSLNNSWERRISFSSRDTKGAKAVKAKEAKAFTSFPGSCATCKRGCTRLASRRYSIVLQKPYKQRGVNCSIHKARSQNDNEIWQTISSNLAHLCFALLASIATELFLSPTLSSFPKTAPVRNQYGESLLSTTCIKFLIAHRHNIVPRSPSHTPGGIFSVFEDENFVLSNELTTVELSPWKIWKAIQNSTSTNSFDKTKFHVSLSHRRGTTISLQTGIRFFRFFLHSSVLSSVAMIIFIYITTVSHVILRHNWIFNLRILYR